MIDLNVFLNGTLIGQLHSDDNDIKLAKAIGGYCSSEMGRSVGYAIAELVANRSRLLLERFK